VCQLNCFICYLLVVNINTIRQGGEAKPKKGKLGKLTPNTVIQFEKAEASALNLVGKAKGYCSNKFYNIIA
jgi:hypothetical protein